MADEKTKTQFERFAEAARQLGCDDDKKRFEAKLGKIAKAKPEEHKRPSGQRGSKKA
jgi:hypothetical protein